MRYHAIAAAAAMVLTMGVGAPTIAAADVTAEEATRRVNVAGRQRMLSQRMAKAACLMSTGIAADDHRGQMDAAYALFLQSDAALRVGDPEMGLQEETLNQVLNALSEIDTPWAAYRRVIELAQREGAVPEDRLMPLNATSLEVLRTMNAAVNTTARGYEFERIVADTISKGSKSRQPDGGRSACHSPPTAPFTTMQNRESKI